MAGKFEKTENKKPKWPKIAALCLLLIAVVLLLAYCLYAGNDKPLLTVQTPQKISLANSGEFTLDVTVNRLGQALYPAASMSIRFDPSRLEFLGVAEGNVFIHDDENQAGIAQGLPQWSCNPQACNESGLINIMYLDMTGGRHAFSQELLAEEDNVVLRLRFRLRGSARAGDVLDVVLEDAVFAASDESQSLAMTTDTLRTKNGKIVVGE